MVFPGRTSNVRRTFETVPGPLDRLALGDRIVPIDRLPPPPLASVSATAQRQAVASAIAAARPGSLIRLESALVPVDPALAAATEWSPWLGEVVEVQQDALVVQWRPEACPLLDAAANPQRWPGDSESPDWTLQYRMIFVSAPRPRLVQRTATTTTTVCHTPRQALDTTPPMMTSATRHPSGPAMSAYFCPLIAAALGHAPIPEATREAWSRVRQRIGPELFDASDLRLVVTPLRMMLNAPDHWTAEAQQAIFDDSRAVASPSVGLLLCVVRRLAAEADDDTDQFARPSAAAPTCEQAYEPSDAELRVLTPAAQDRLRSILPPGPLRGDEEQARGVGPADYFNGRRPAGRLARGSDPSPV